MALQAPDGWLNGSWTQARPTRATPGSAALGNRAGRAGRWLRVWL